MTPIYHITTRSAWASALRAGQYCHPSLTAEGFIHCSREDQILRVANALYRSREDLVILKLNPQKIEAIVRDDCTESGEVFPHIYGPVDTDAVEDVLDLNPEADGTFHWPVKDESSLSDAKIPVAAGSEGLYPSSHTL